MKKTEFNKQVVKALQLSHENARIVNGVVVVHDNASYAIWTVESVRNVVTFKQVNSHSTTTIKTDYNGAYMPNMVALTVKRVLKAITEYRKLL